MTIAVFLIFGHAELAGLFPQKSGGLGVLAYAAWRNSDFAKRHPRIVDLFGILGVWGYWWGWTPVATIGALIAGAYTMYLFPQLPSTILFIPTDIFVGILYLCGLYAINYFGITESALFAKIFAVILLTPLTIVTVAPWFAGLIRWGYYQPFLPLNWQTGQMEPSWFTWPAIYGIIGGLFIAQWCDYAYECCTVYTPEYTDPRKETFKAVGAATVLNAFYYILLPITLIGVFPIEFIKEDPYLVFPELGAMLMGDFGRYFMTAMLMAAVLLMMNQALNGGGRSLYQMAEDGQQPKQFAILNKYRIPAVSMLFSLFFIIALMFMRVPIVILAASGVFVQDRPGWKAWGEHLLPDYMISPPKPGGTRRKSSIPDIIGHIIGLLLALAVAIVIVAGITSL
jgi:amino acid transporter